MLTLRARNPAMAKSLISFALRVQNTFSDRLVALYVSRHPSIEIDGYNALIVLKEAKPEDQEIAIKLALESCKDLKPEEQIAPLVVGESDEWIEMRDQLTSPPSHGWNLAAHKFFEMVKNTFSDRLVALYVSRHPSIEIDGYNALIVLKEAKPEDQEIAIKLALESCKDLKPEEQIAPLVVGERELGEIPSEFRKEV